MEPIGAAHAAGRFEMHGKRIAIGVVAGMVLAGGALWSGHAHAWGRHHGDVGMDGAMTVIAMVRKADLTDAQEKQVAIILGNHKPALEQKSARASEARRGVMGQMTADVVDANALAAAIDQAAASGKELALEWAQVRQEVQALLTLEQVSDLKQMRDKFMKKADARRAEHEQDRGERLDHWINRLSR
jgi:Spy/CpxP family protein refolding chaperone